MRAANLPALGEVVALAVVCVHHDVEGGIITL